MARKVGIGRILFHTVMTFITGGIWLIGLVVRALIK